MAVRASGSTILTSGTVLGRRKDLPPPGWELDGVELPAPRCIRNASRRFRQFRVELTNDFI